ncbi:hypothetical protein ASD45_13110 [Pseudolabrys sp. Root1462]|uniref:DUF1214 domain-containing protein n=1 Tax=Pseudolabrys sp. Root1462 TaxID=1736466 RepID=UPI000702EDE3|nr:DUF1214 domain-containing protein [Pseudolabrys sp. Root1462]KQZ01687.1 hypothetical protein ASD45_13110 [Pseudolabrys sp. Root1462]
MRLLTSTLFALLVAAAVGLGLTYFALTRGAAFGALTIGSWTAWPKTGTADADPYARATIARTGELPVALGDGVSFTAQSDDDDRPLDGRCDVVLFGVTPAARFWTLTLYNRDGGLVANSIDRFGFTSQEIVRRADGSFEITVSPRATPGNWLPTAGVERYSLVLRLYDTAVGVATKAGREVPMPSIETRRCP